jgi:hypothetical protein
MLDRTQLVTTEEIATAAFYRTDRQAAIVYRERSICQIDENSEGAWYLIRTEPGRDLTAMRNLARRRFGVFLPMKGLKRVFPGWLCAYVFDIKDNEQRVLACPGVMGVLKVERTVNGKPQTMPVKVDMAFIRGLAAQAWQGDVPPPRPKHEAKSTKSKARKITAQRGRKLSKLKKAMKRADREGELARALDIRAQITALRHKFSAPCGVTASSAGA